MADLSLCAIQEIVLWNPSLDQTPEDPELEKVYNYPCTLSTSVSYCLSLTSHSIPTTFAPIEPPYPRASGEAQDCSVWTHIEENWGCAEILDLYRLTIQEFYDMNPTVGQDCTGLSLGSYYCVRVGRVLPPDEETITTSPPTTSTGTTSTGTTTGPTSTITSDIPVVTPTPIREGMASNCNKFFLRDDPNMFCFDIAATNQVSLEDFYLWNPAVNSDCSGLWPDYYYCVGVRTTATTTTVTPTTTTAAPVVTPSPIRVS